MRPRVSFCALVSVYSRRIRAARGYAGISQSQLAEALGVDEQTIKRRESPNGKEPKKGERVAIAAICGVPLDFLEQGFGRLAQDEVAERLARIEFALGVHDSESATESLEAETAQAAQRHDERSGRSARAQPAPPKEGRSR